jgi:sialidase-1
MALQLLVGCAILATAAATAGFGSTETPPHAPTPTNLPVVLSTLFPYHKPKGGYNSGSGNWWGASFSVTKHGTVLVAGLLKLQTKQHEVPTELDLRRSEDGGLSWGTITALVSDPTNTSMFGGGGLIYSAASDTVFFLYLDAPQPKPAIPQALPIRAIHSKDDGITWSLPVTVGANLTGGEILGHGIELAYGAHKGRLVIGTNQWVGAGPKWGPGFDLRVYSIYSDDGGVSWERGEDFPVPFTPLEATIAEISNGSLIISTRNAYPRGDPKLAFCTNGTICHTFGRSDDGGVTWPVTWTLPVEQLPIYGCQPTLISTADGSKLYFGAPMNTTTADRWNYTVYTSVDGGRQWEWLTGVFGGPSGYSDMALLANGELAVGFQRGLGIEGMVGTGYEMAYARVNTTTALHVKSSTAVESATVVPAP